MSETQQHYRHATLAVEGKFDPAVLKGRTILSSHWSSIEELMADDLLIEGGELPPGVTARVSSIGATVILRENPDAPVRTYKDMFLVTATDANGVSVPFSQKGDGGKLVTTRKGEVVGVICGGGKDAAGNYDTVLVPAEQFTVGAP